MCLLAFSCLIIDHASLSTPDGGRRWEIKIRRRLFFSRKEKGKSGMQRFMRESRAEHGENRGGTVLRENGKTNYGNRNTKI